MTENNSINNSEMIKAFDNQGREFYVTRQDWVKKILPDNFKKVRNDPDKLYGLLVMCLQDGFIAEIIPQAEHLLQIDPDGIRAATILGIVYMKSDRLNDAQKVFENCNIVHGENGVILVNLAKVYAVRGDKDRAEEILWHGLEVDPNQDNGLLWYAVIHRERGGNQCELDAFRRVASLPGSWRAQLWLARDALEHKDGEKAKTLYATAFDHVGRPIPADFLMQVSGDLCKNDYILDAIELVQPWFNPELHGLQVGHNLIAANYSLRRISEAQYILNQLYALNRYDWLQTLNSWRDKLATLQN
jgi:tetratricopeptide (TPR) repeat protein